MANQNFNILLEINRVLLETLKKTLACGCYSVNIGGVRNDPDYHSERCHVPAVKAAIKLATGVLPHHYTDATDDTAAYAADQCNRQAITVDFAFTMDADETFYLFNYENYSVGFDPWVTIDGGIDRSTNDPNKYFLCYGKTLEVQNDTRIFVGRKSLAKFLRGK